VRILDYIKNLGSAFMGRPRAMSPQDLERMILGMDSNATSSGVSINPETAMRLITVQKCIRLRSATIQRLPCHLMETDGKMKKKAEDHYLYEKLLHQPNSWMTAPEFWGMAEALVSLRGNFIAYKAGLPGRPIRELIPIPYSMIRNITQNEDYSIDYEIHFPNGDIRHLNQKQVFHLRPFTLNGYVGLSPVEYARETMGLTSAGWKFLAQFFAKGMRPGVIFEHPEVLGAKAHANRKAALKEKYENLGNFWEMMLIDENMKATFPEVKLVDAQFLELMKMTEAQICGLYRVPLMLVCAGDKAETYASSEQFMLLYQMYSIDCTSYESAIRRDLIEPEERGRFYAKFNMNALQRGDFKTRMEGYQIGINAEILNPNEARDLEDKNPYEGGDVFRTRTSTVKDSSPKQADGGAKQ